ncbi:MAG: EamA family transporter RarD [Microbacteriaceae bacterium]
MPPSRRTAALPDGRGLILAIAAYALWGFFPIYFALVAPASALEIVSWRVVLSLLFCAILVSATRAWRSVQDALRNRRVVLLLGLAGSLIAINWATYVITVISGNVVEAALGYFMNPIVTVLLGVIVLRERLRPMQWASVAVTAVAAVVLALGYGSFPWLAFILALTFGGYSLVKKQVGPRVDATTGLTIETAWLTPIAMITLTTIASTGGLVIGTISPLHTTLLLLAGVVTAIPLLLFASAAHRLPLSYLGLLQYLTPVLQLLVGVLVFHEPMPPQRLAGFILVWIALIILTVDMLTAGRSPRRTSVEPI